MWARAVALLRGLKLGDSYRISDSVTALVKGSRIKRYKYVPSCDAGGEVRSAGCCDREE